MTETTIGRPRRWGRLLAVLAALAALGTVALAGTSLAASNGGSDASPGATTDETDVDSDASEQEVEDDGDAASDAEFEEWHAYDDCLGEALGDGILPGGPGEFDLEDLDDLADLDDEAIEQHFAAFAEAEEACRAELPEDIRTELAEMDEAWQAYDDCVAELGIEAGIGFDAEHDFGGVVTVETPDGVQIIEFGDEQGSVTISGTEGELTVETDGAVDVVTEADLEELFEAEEAVFEACDSELPEGAFDFELGDFGSGSADFGPGEFDFDVDVFGEFDDFDFEQLEELFGDRFDELSGHEGETTETATA